MFIVFGALTLLAGLSVVMLRYPFATKMAMVPTIGASWAPALVNMPQASASMVSTEHLSNQTQSIDTFYAECLSSLTAHHTAQDLAITSVFQPLEQGIEKGIRTTLSIRHRQKEMACFEHHFVLSYDLNHSSAYLQEVISYRSSALSKTWSSPSYRIELEAIPENTTFITACNQIVLTLNQLAGLYFQKQCMMSKLQEIKNRKIAEKNPDMGNSHAQTSVKGLRYCQVYQPILEKIFHETTEKDLDFCFAREWKDEDIADDFFHTKKSLVFKKESSDICSASLLFQNQPSQSLTKDSVQPYFSLIRAQAS